MIDVSFHRKKKGKRRGRGRAAEKKIKTARVPRQPRFNGIRGKDKHPATKTPLIAQLAASIFAASQRCAPAPVRMSFDSSFLLALFCCCLV